MTDIFIDGYPVKEMRISRLGDSNFVMMECPLSDNAAYTPKNAKIQIGYFKEET